MKNVLLASTALVLTAGFASAEITFSGTAGAGVFKQGKVANAAVAATSSSDLVIFDADGTASTTGGGVYTGIITAVADASGDQLATGDVILSGTNGSDAVAASTTAAADHYSVYSGIDINIKASTTTDNGMTISAATDMGAGSLLDAGDRELDAQTDALTAPEVKITYSGVTVELESEGVQDYYDGDLNNYDVGISGAMGAISYGLALETDRREGAEATGGDSDWSAQLKYSADGVTVTMNTNELNGTDDLTTISASYAMGAATFTATSDNKGAAKDVATFKVAYVAGPATLTLSAANDKDNAGNTNKGGRGSWDATVKYVTGAYTINATTNESDAWNANVAYDLGGGATMTVGADSTETSFAGVSFAF